MKKFLTIFVFTILALAFSVFSPIAASPKNPRAGKVDYTVDLITVREGLVLKPAATNNVSTTNSTSGSLVTNGTYTTAAVVGGKVVIDVDPTKVEVMQTNSVTGGFDVPSALNFTNPANKFKGTFTGAALLTSRTIPLSEFFLVSSTIDTTGSSPMFCPGINLPKTGTFANTLYVPFWATNYVINVLMEWEGTVPLTWTNRDVYYTYPNSGRAGGAVNRVFTLTNSFTWVTFSNSFGAVASGVPRLFEMDNVGLGAPTNTTDFVRIIKVRATWGGTPDTTND